MTAEVALRLGQAVAQRFRHPDRPGRIVIGKDTRLSGLHARERAGGRHRLGGRRRDAGGAAADAGHRLHHLVDARRRRRGDQRVAQPVPGQRHQDLRRRRLQAARRGRGATRAADGGDRRRLPAARGRRPTDRQGGRASTTPSGATCSSSRTPSPRSSRSTASRSWSTAPTAPPTRSRPRCSRSWAPRSIELDVWPDGRNINDQCGALHPEAMAAEVRAHGRAAGHRARRRRRSGDPRRREGRTSSTATRSWRSWARRMLERGDAAAADGGGDGDVQPGPRAGAGERRAASCCARAVGDRYVVEAMRERGLLLRRRAVGAHHLPRSRDHRRRHGGGAAGAGGDGRRRGGRCPSWRAAMTRYPQVLLNFPVAQEAAARRAADGAAAHRQGRARPRRRRAGAWSATRAPSPRRG